MTRYVATVNVPGYLPVDDDPPVFDTARDAWDYLAGERQRGEDDAYSEGDDQDYSDTVQDLQQHSPDTGTVYGPTPGYEGEHDLGLAYSVSIAEEGDEAEPHVGHYSNLGGQWWCDTCNSPYCEQA